MMIALACPAPASSRKGNRVTANRWTDILLSVGCDSILYLCNEMMAHCDLLVALHARKSYPAIALYRKLRPDGPLIVALTGTDVYHDIHTSKRAQRSLELADRLVVLQERAADELPPRLRRKVRVIYQSALPVGDHPPRSRRPFRVSVLGHLRAEKDPFRAALALRLLPKDLAIEVTQLGEALSPAMERRALELMRLEPRYRWLGEVSGKKARRYLARSHVMVLSSRLEGGANVLSEAIADGVPVLGSNIPGNIGILGKRYPGYCPVGDTEGLAALLERAAMDTDFYSSLKKWVVGLKPLVRPAREREAWKKLLAELL
jgi:putative glycosyltransferase (TIGR04348 family)